jgi:hypothetical protein
MTQIKLSPQPKSSSPKTPFGRITEQFLLRVSDPLGVIGQHVLGAYWQTLCSSIQDAVALALILKVPSAIGGMLLSKDFNGFNVCLDQNPFGVERYACFIIVASDFCLWIVIAGRTIARFWTDWRGLRNSP